MKAFGFIAGVIAAGVLLPTTAAAQELGGGFPDQGTFSVGAERIFGFASTSHSEERELPGPGGGSSVEQETSNTSFYFLGSGADTAFTPSYFLHPRVGFDYFIIDSLSLGGSLAYISNSEESETFDADGDRIGETDVDTTGFLFAPRVGYAYMFSDVVGIWPRGGFTYVNVSQDTDGSDSNRNVLALSIEIMFPILPVPHGGFVVGPTLDWGFTGGGEYDPPGPEDSADVDKHKVTTIGIQAGMLLWF